MPMIGLSCSLGNTRRTRNQDAIVLTRQLQDIFGATLEGLWLGDDIVVDGAGLVTSWPGRVGGTLTNSTVNRFAIGEVNGRRATATGTLGQLKSLWVSGTSNIYSHIAVATMQSPRANYETITNSRNEANFTISRNQQQATIYTHAGAYTHFVNGVASTTFPASGVAIVESDTVIGTLLTTGTSVGGGAAADYIWPGNIMAVVALTANPTVAMRAAYVPPMRQYCRLP